MELGYFTAFQPLYAFLRKDAVRRQSFDFAIFLRLGVGLEVTVSHGSVEEREGHWCFLLISLSYSGLEFQVDGVLRKIMGPLFFSELAFAAISN